MPANMHHTATQASVHCWYFQQPRGMDDAHKGVEAHRQTVLVRWKSTPALQVGCRLRQLCFLDSAGRLRVCSAVGLSASCATHR